MDSLSSFNFLLSAFVAWLLYLTAKFIRQRRFYKDLPKPPHSFLWGHLKLFGEYTARLPPNTHPQAFYTLMKKEYNLPGLFYVDLWPLGPTQVIITDPDLAAQITTVKSLPKHEGEARFLDPIVGDGPIATINGPHWKLWHSILSPAFAASSVKNLAKTIGEEALVFHDILDKYTKSGEAFSMEETAGKLVFDTTSRTAFNYSLNAQKGGSQPLRDYKETIRQFTIGRETWNPIVKFMANERMKAGKDRVGKFLQAKIQERFALLQNENADVTRKQGLSILDLVLRDHIMETRKASGNASQILDKNFLERATTNIRALLFGAQGTTTGTICYILLLLSINPEVVTKLRAEHDRVFGSKLEATLPILEHSPHKLNDLEYTTAVINDTMRLFPSGFTIRKADTLTYQGRVYPVTDHMLSPVSHTMHYDPDIFPNPTKFDPERFLREGEVPRNAWRPFERGPRGCLGQPLAVDVLRIVLLMTVRDFEFRGANLKPNAEPRVGYTDLDTILGDAVFQELKTEAAPRDGMMMTVRRSNRS